VKGGSGRPIPIDELRRVASAYLSGDSFRQIVAEFRREGYSDFTRITLHNRLQQIRQRTGVRSNSQACTAILYEPERYEYKRPDFTPTIERRAELRRQGLKYREIAEREGVSVKAIQEHFQRHRL
jgi:transposase